MFFKRLSLVMVFVMVLSTFAISFGQVGLDGKMTVEDLLKLQKDDFLKERSLNKSEAFLEVELDVLEDLLEEINDDFEDYLDDYDDDSYDDDYDDDSDDDDYDDDSDDDDYDDDSDDDDDEDSDDDDDEDSDDDDDEDSDDDDDEDSDDDDDEDSDDDDDEDSDDDDDEDSDDDDDEDSDDDDDEDSDDDDDEDSDDDDDEDSDDDDDEDSDDDDDDDDDDSYDDDYRHHTVFDRDWDFEEIINETIDVTFDYDYDDNEDELEAYFYNKYKDWTFEALLDRYVEVRALLERAEEKSYTIRQNVRSSFRSQYSEEDLEKLLQVKSLFEQVYENIRVLEVDSIISNGTYFKFDTPPVINNGRTLVPVAAIAMGLKATVTWNGEDRTVTITKDGKTIFLVIDDHIAYIDGEAVEMDTQARIMNGRTMVPLRFVAEALDLTVEWNAEDETIELIDEEKIIVDDM